MANVLGAFHKRQSFTLEIKEREKGRVGRLGRERARERERGKSSLRGREAEEDRRKSGQWGREIDQTGRETRREREADWQQDTEREIRGTERGKGIGKERERDMI